MLHFVPSITVFPNILQLRYYQNLQRFFLTFLYFFCKGNSMNILVWQYIQMPHFVSIIRSFLIFYFMGLVIHHWRKFLKQILSIAIDNLQFRLVFTSVKFCCKKVWWCVFYYVPSNKVLCLSKNRWKKYQSISSKHESFRIIFKIVRKSIFEQNYTFYVISWDFFCKNTIRK